MLQKAASLGIQALLLGRQPACEPHLTRRVQGASRYRGPCHHLASSPGGPDRRTEPLPPRQPPLTPLAPCLRGRVGRLTQLGPASR